MSKIVFFCIPAHGHTNPTLGVVRELIKRGHEVWYYSYDSMREKIEGAGAKFVSCDEYDPQTKLSADDGERIGKDLAFSTNLIVDMTLALDDAIIKDMTDLQPDVIIADSMAYWGKLIAKKLNIPFISSTTTFAFNRYSAKVMKGKGDSLFSVLFSMPKINKSLNRLREKGYEVKNILSIIENDNDTNTIVYTAPEFQPYAETFSDKYAFVGASIRPITEPMEKTDIPTVYVSLGTVINQRREFFKNCIEALGNRPYRVIMSVGEYTDISSFGELPENIQVVSKVDQMAVLAVADVFITHCGMNSVNEALYFGVPLILVPQTPEQSGVAYRTREVGAGLPLENNEVQTIRDAVGTLLRDETYKRAAKQLSDAFHSLKGAVAAADVIERIV